MDLGGFVLVMVGFTFIICLPVIIHMMRKTPEQKAKEQEKLAQQRATLQERRFAAGNVIVEVKMLGAGSTNYKHGGLGGAVVGGLIAGPIGAVVGASASNGKGVQNQRFAIKYSDGRTEIKELHPNSWEYKELMKYVKWEDLR